MNWEVVGTFMGSLGGATVIVAGFVQFLGGVWADRIAKKTAANFNQELEILKSKNTIALEEFKSKSEAGLKDREQFSGISKEVYQNFFSNRVLTYVKLLAVKNSYLSDMHESHYYDASEKWGDAYYSSYISLRKIMIEDQLYLSNELEKSFSKLRIRVAEYTKEAEMEEGDAMSTGQNTRDIEEAISSAYRKLAVETTNLMQDVLDQIEKDVSKLRSRIEIDKVSS